jgi:phosphopantothenoylcysteine decarboxylase/phosphopantothenate--cysteine ligase
VLAGRRVLLGVTGGIAAYKAVLLARQLVRAGAEVTSVLTASATRFVGADTFSGITGRPAHTSLWERPGEVLHVRLAHETDVAVVAPATANVLAALAQGFAGDLLTATLLEYAGPLVLAPAMHEGMWSHPATQANVATLRDRGAVIVGPEHGALAHGDEGMGRLAEPDRIAAAIDALAVDGDLRGRTILVTAGPTHEPIDPVRFIGNRSSGRMGVAIAVAARRRGAEVTLVLGPDTVPPPPGVEVVRIETADQLYRETLERGATADVVVMAAAVADFRPKRAAETKLKKDQGPPDLVLEPTPDILAEVAAARRPGQVLVGFAAETDDVEAAGRGKLERKAVDILVANRVGEPGTGFGSETNDAAIVVAGGEDEPMRRRTKTDLASAVLDRVVTLLPPAS